MTVRAVTSLEEYRDSHGIELLLSQPWPKSRANDFRVAVREQADLELRVTICGFCGAESRPLDGPTGRAWFASHECRAAA